MNKDPVYILYTIPECVVISKYVHKFFNSPCFKRWGLCPPGPNRHSGRAQLGGGWESAYHCCLHSLPILGPQYLSPAVGRPTAGGYECPTTVSDA